MEFIQYHTLNQSRTSFVACCSIRQDAVDGKRWRQRRRGRLSCCQSSRTLLLALIITIFSLCHIRSTRAFVIPTARHGSVAHTPVVRLENEYDAWRSDAVPLKRSLDEDNVQHCMSLFINSDYGNQMFGCHNRASDIGITGSLEFVELAGPEVTLALSGKFWHRRETVLGRAAMWLHACMPEIILVNVADKEELKDFEEVLDEITGEVIFTKDKRSPDFNGDRQTMEYQGMDPDARGPFPL